MQVGGGQTPGMGAPSASRLSATPPRARWLLAVGVVALVLSQAVLLVHSTLDNHDAGGSCQLCLGGHSAGSAQVANPAPQVAPAGGELPAVSRLLTAVPKLAHRAWQARAPPARS